MVKVDDLKVKYCDSNLCRIYIAGNYEDAVRICKEFCIRGLCVNVQKTNYIYKYGKESGVIVEVINYPRFPVNKEDMEGVVTELAKELLFNLHQGSCSVYFNDQTMFLDRRDYE